MKSLIKAVAIAAVLAAPVVSFAQSNQPVTRAQVRSELIQLEKAGYNPATASDPTYPADIQAAEARVQAQNGAVAQAAAADTGYGTATNGSSQSGAAKRLSPAQNNIYFGN
ncbi:DUF4148 domain-containing protein [Paraburkholderia diazotrophica]|uniref:DUF4148 domain-containing protein n=1 Tax=Paraburkholderia diazotrophica TaxID=667676 RepID=A0A1H7EDH8_9BURK|nr:DUF4148 domain-containing protein [Paraburkholderia diazotrophica]SEK12003.1 protein of unknown function [Paraburkholderia diazotrophica]